MHAPKGTDEGRSLKEAIDLVVLLRAFDVDRFHILKRSLDLFWRVPGVIRILAPDEDVEFLERVLGGCGAVQILPESQLIPYLREAPRGNGWWKQQALKLEAHSIVETDFYLVLDADCLVVRPVEYGDLVRDGRGLVHLEGEEGSLSTEQWYRHSSKVLSLPNPGRLVGLTPFLFSREISSKLVEHLRSLHGEDRPDGTKDCWRNLLSGSFRWNFWTEFTLYHTFAEGTGLWEARHIGSPTPLTGNSVWEPERFETWDPAACFDRPSFLFSVLQSNTRIPCGAYWRQVRPFLNADDVPSAGASLPLVKKLEEGIFKSPSRGEAFRIMTDHVLSLRSPQILETGCARAMKRTEDEPSTIIFDALTQERDGTFTTVDIDPTHCRLARMLCSERTQVINASSLDYLPMRARDSSLPPLDLVYLDSLDVDFDSPHESALHHLEELCAIEGRLAPGALVAVDDNRVEGGRVVSGKGMYVAEHLRDRGAELIHDGYVHIWRMGS